MDDIQQEETLAADTIPQNDIEDNFLDIKYNHTPMVLSKEEARELAQKGLNYDKIVSRLQQQNPTTSLAEENSISYEEPLENEIEATHSGEFDYFFKKFSKVDPREIPAEVIEDYNLGTPLHNAYEKHLLKEQITNALSEISSIKENFMKETANENNAKNSVGSISGGEIIPNEFYSEQELDSLSETQIKNNLDKALNSMCHISKQKQKPFFN